MSVFLEEEMGISSDISPKNGSLFTSNNLTKAQMEIIYNTEAAEIYWSAFGTNGTYTGKSGRFKVDNINDSNRYTINTGNNTTMSFDIEYGKLIEGNTFSINTDTFGHPIAMNMFIDGRANLVSNLINLK